MTAHGHRLGDGLGLSVLPWYAARESVLEGQLQPVMADHV